MTATMNDQGVNGHKGYDPFQAAANKLLAVDTEFDKFIIGQEPLKRTLKFALVTGKPVVLIGESGLAKSWGTQVLAKLCGVPWARIQITPDILPADVVGSMAYDQVKNEMYRRLGPFERAPFVHGDELNRGAPKTLNAFLEVIDEGQISIDGVTHQLSPVRTFVGTMNPAHYIDTEEVSEAFLNRLAMSCIVGYPTPKEEEDILKMRLIVRPEHKAVLDKADIMMLRDSHAEVMSQSAGIFGPASRAVALMRTDKFHMKASPRVTQDLVQAAAFRALLDGRGAATLPDLQAVFESVASHRVEFVEANNKQAALAQLAGRIR